MTRSMLKRVAIAALLGATLQPISQAADPINALSVELKTVAGVPNVSGWHFAPMDLNSGVGGRYVYAGWRRGSTAPVTEIDFKEYSLPQTSNPRAGSGWEWDEDDLNKLAGGKYVYMFYKKGTSQGPIYNMMFVASSYPITPPRITGWTHVGCDLNEGAGRPHIWAYITRDASRGSDPSSNTLLRTNGGKVAEPKKNDG